MAQIQHQPLEKTIPPPPKKENFVNLERTNLNQSNEISDTISASPEKNLEEQTNNTVEAPQIREIRPEYSIPANNEQITEQIPESGGIVIDEQEAKFAKHEQIFPIEKQGDFLDETIDSLKKILRISPKKKNVQIPTVRDDITEKVEKIMEEGLKDAFLEMTTIQQQEFKIKGEQTAAQIRTLLRATHVKAKKIFQLIVEWLKLLPGVNRFFIEQEAKIKSDKIISIKERQNEK